MHGAAATTPDGGFYQRDAAHCLGGPELWNSLNSALLSVMYGIQHFFTQDLQTIQQAQEQLAGFSQQVAGFDQALNGTDLVVDPTTSFFSNTKRRTPLTIAPVPTSPVITSARLEACAN